MLLLLDYREAIFLTLTKVTSIAIARVMQKEYNIQHHRRRSAVGESRVGEMDESRAVNRVNVRHYLLITSTGTRTLYSSL